MRHGKGPTDPVSQGWSKGRAGGPNHQHPHDSRFEALCAAAAVLLRHRMRRPRGATWVSLGEAIGEAILRRFRG